MSTLLRDWVASRAPPAPSTTQDAGTAARAGPSSLLEQLPRDALVLVCDALPPATVAGPLAAASPALRDVAHGGDAWRLRFEPRLPREFVETLDRAAPGAWPRVYGALAGNLLAGAATWRGVEGGGMRAWLPSRDAPPWRVVCHGGHGWRVEPEPEGAPPVPAAPPRRSFARGAPPPPRALASSFAWCEVLQEIDLLAPCLAAGMSPDVAADWLDSGAVTLHASVWAAARFDCGAAAAVSLHADDGAALWPHYHGRPSFDYAARALASWASPPLDPPRGGWARVAGALRLPPGARRALLVVGGRDTRFWAGHYGAKFAAPCVRFGFVEGHQPGGAVAGVGESG